MQLLNWQPIRPPGLIFFAVFSVLLTCELGYFYASTKLQDRLPLGTSFGAKDLSLQTTASALSDLQAQIAEFLAQPLRFQLAQRTLTLAPAAINLQIQPPKLPQGLINFTPLNLAATLDSARLQAALTEQLPQLKFQTRNATLSFTASGELLLHPESFGFKLNLPALSAQISQAASQLKNPIFQIKLRKIKPPLTRASLQRSKTFLQKIPQPLIFKATEFERFELPLAASLDLFSNKNLNNIFNICNYLHSNVKLNNNQDSFTPRNLPLLCFAKQLLDPTQDSLPKEILKIFAGHSFLSASLDLLFNVYTNFQKPSLDLAAVQKFIAKELGPFFAKAAVGATLRETAPGEIEFTGIAQNGRKIETPVLIARLAAALQTGQSEIAIPFQKITSPLLIPETLKAKGVRDLIASVETTYTGSPANRKHNIQTGAQKLNGFVLAPDAGFSFLQALGPISGTASYQKELIIRKGELVPEIGGGICQVSTTIFRAALKAGLPITAQRAHSLKIKYYHPPGLDAAIYPGQLDLKFQNDTGYPILFQVVASAPEERLRVNLFGRADEREVTLQGPFYPNGQPIQDLELAGLKMFWLREIKKNGRKLIREKYSSAYSR